MAGIEPACKKVFDKDFYKFSRFNFKALVVLNQQNPFNASLFVSEER